jgi:two-component system, sensor histidine kinase and response regulator
MDAVHTHREVEGDLLATVFDVARIGICVIDQEGRFVHVNPAICQMLQYRQEELVGEYYELAAPPTVAAVSDKFLAAVLADSSKIPNEWKIRRKDNSLLDALVSFRTVRRADRRIYIVVTFSDISEHKKTQSEIEELNSRLEARISERTAELETKIAALTRAEQALKLSDESTRLVLDTALDAVVE